ncbi:MAG: uroporphyrinogen decarboxylase family protein [Planctomycetota bacterium]
MRSKERVLAAFSHEAPDRVPINYMANPGMDGRLKAYFGLEQDDTGGLNEVLGVDFIGVGTAYIGPRIHAEIPNRRVDPIMGFHLRWVEHGSGGYWDYCDFPLKEADEEQVAAWPLACPDDFDYSVLEDACKKNERFAIHYGDAGLACIMNTAGFLRGMEQAFVDVATDDPAGLLLIDRILDMQYEVASRALDKVGKKIDFMWIGEDLGTQIAPMISMELLKRNIKPRHQRFLDLAKAYDLPVMLHTCGSSSWAYEEYIKMGLKAVDTLQPEAKNMSPKYLKEHFGGRLVFHGCISTAGPVTFGDPERVAANVRETLEIMMPGGGYCLAPTHCLQDNSPVENVVAMYEAAHEYGRYVR